MNSGSVAQASDDLLNLSLTVSELQRIVDSLARSTNRVVSAQDTNRSLLAHSAHPSEIDEVRKELILSRKGPAKGYAWARSFGIEKSPQPVRIPPNPELAMEARIAAPIRFDGKLLGFLWLIDPQESLPDDSMPLIQSAAKSAALAMHQEELMRQIDRGRERELMRDLLSDQSDVRSHAADDLVETGLLVPSELTVVLVVRPLRDREVMSPNDAGLRSRIERVLSDSRQHVPMHQALHLMRPDHGVFLVTCNLREAESLLALGEEINQRTSTVLNSDGAWRSAIGIGDPQTKLADAYLSYKQARKGAEVAGFLGSIGPVVKWSELGVYQMLAQVSPSEVNIESLHPGLGRLFAARDSQVWLQTLECYLDLAGDARGAAKTLFVNRGTLYHRIHRIEEIAGVDLSSGRDRLALHLGLKLARLAGLLDRPATAEAR